MLLYPKNPPRDNLENCRSSRRALPQFSVLLKTPQCPKAVIFSHVGSIPENTFRGEINTNRIIVASDRSSIPTVSMNLLIGSLSRLASLDASIHFKSHPEPSEWKQWWRQTIFGVSRMKRACGTRCGRPTIPVYSRWWIGVIADKSINISTLCYEWVNGWLKNKSISNIPIKGYIYFLFYVMQGTR